MDMLTDRDKVAKMVNEMIAEIHRGNCQDVIDVLIDSDLHPKGVILTAAIVNALSEDHAVRFMVALGEAVDGYKEGEKDA